MYNSPVPRPGVSASAEQPAAASPAAANSRGRRKRLPSAIAEAREAATDTAVAAQAPVLSAPADGEPATAASAAADAGAAPTKSYRRRKAASPADSPASAAADAAPASAAADAGAAPTKSSRRRKAATPTQTPDSPADADAAPASTAADAPAAAARPASTAESFGEGPKPSSKRGRKPRSASADPHASPQGPGVFASPEEPAAASDAAVGSSRGRPKRLSNAIAEAGEAQAGATVSSQDPASSEPVNRRRKAAVRDAASAAAADEDTATTIAAATAAAASAATAARPASHRSTAVRPANLPAAAAPAPASTSPAAAPPPPAPVGPAGPFAPPKQPLLGLYAPLGALGGAPPPPPQQPAEEAAASSGRWEGEPPAGGLSHTDVGIGAGSDEEQREEGAVPGDPAQAQAQADGARAWVSDRHRIRATSYRAARSLQAARRSPGVPKPSAPAAAPPVGGPGDDLDVLEMVGFRGSGAKDGKPGPGGGGAAFSAAELAGIAEGLTAAEARLAAEAGRAEAAMAEVWKALKCSTPGAQMKLWCGMLERRLLLQLGPGQAAARARTLAGLLVEQKALAALLRRRPGWLLAREPEQALSRLLQLAEAVGVAVADVLDVAAVVPRLLDEQPDTVRQRTAEMAAALSGGLAPPPSNPRALVAAMIRQRPSLLVAGAGDWGWRLRMLREWGFVSKAAALLRARRYDPSLACGVLAELVGDDGTAALRLAFPSNGDVALRDRLRPVYAEHGDVGVVTECPEIRELGFRHYTDPLAPEHAYDRKAVSKWVGDNRERLMQLARGDEDRTGQGPDRAGQGSSGGGLVFSEEEVLAAMSAIEAKQAQRRAKAVAMMAAAGGPVAAAAAGGSGAPGAAAAAGVAGRPEGAGARPRPSASQAELGEG
ncbi:hypothetical protein HYH03_010268 [Edaphochlamys debaryana]|uniref:Uncharacterized protein n=1 Tax=Edaphochlamys debaryana TaxID=47281 RepID=A0A836BXR7_9CHLO|nr:hypothetical protein HYH03_010268 [Edaphochlamys debaryana]|eukprot:KAG2491484.1 hypothetical protein HYH03_010268 [Edaphochlamys debaryana]